MVGAKKRIVIAALVVVAAALVFVGWSSVSAQDEGGFKLEGAWVARVTSFNGGPYPCLTQWSYVVAADASRRKASFHGSVDAPFCPASPGSPDVYATPILGEVIQTGPDTAIDNSIWYTIRKASPIYQIVNIGVAKGEWKFLGPGKIETTVRFAIYLPAADTDGDGIPEPDATPIAQFTVTTLDTRVPLPR